MLDLSFLSIPSLQETQASKSGFSDSEGSDLRGLELGLLDRILRQKGSERRNVNELWTIRHQDGKRRRSVHL